MDRLDRLAVLFALVLALGIAIAQEKNFNEGRIIGGYPAPDGAYPYQVSLKDTKNNLICSGSIISKNWILTVAHCTYGQKAKNIKVVAGTNFLNSGGTSYKVSKIVNHSAYNQQSKLNDLSLLKTSKNIKFTNKIKSVVLAGFPVAPGTFCLLSGWGSIRYPSQNVSNTLQQLSLRTISVPQCQSALPSYPIYYNHTCTSNGLGQGACNGDSGSPLACGGELHGVLSWGIPCAKGYPDVFTSVAAHRLWIKSVSKV